MPELSWEELDTALHDIKGDLTKLVAIEVLCKELREKLGEQIEYMHKIILKQVDNNNAPKG